MVTPFAMVPIEVLEAYLLTVGTAAVLALLWGVLRVVVMVAGRLSGDACGRVYLNRDGPCCVLARGHMGAHRQAWDTRGRARHWPNYLCETDHFSQGQRGLVGRMLYLLRWR